MSVDMPPWGEGLPEEREIVPFLQKPPSSKVLKPGEVVAEGEVLKFDCRYCEHPEAVVMAGKGPHAAQLRCLSCHRHLHWFARSQVAA